LISEDGAKLNDIALTNAGLILEINDFKTPVKLSKEKKKHALIKLL
jgi:tyrosyl-tRNA synthetase